MDKSWSANQFQINIPEVYQLELTNQCNLHCPHCIRALANRPTGYLDISLLQKMVSRGDFAGSFFVEFQMYGEPLMHPHFDKIVDYMKENTNVKLGLSTNGALIPKWTNAISKLDYLTISVDSADKATYESMRGCSYDELLSNTEMVLKQNPRPVVDLQVINFFDGRNNLPDLVKLAKQHNWDVICRAVYDCFAAYYGRAHPDRFGDLCLNPWLSVSVHWDGDVVPCCFSSGKEVVYGNLNDASLRTIWNESQQRRQLMYRQRHGQNLIPCSKCYMRSPALLHLRMLMNNLKEQ